MKNMLNIGCLALLFALTACPTKEKVEPKSYDGIIFYKVCLAKSCFIKIDNDTTIYYPYNLADSLVPRRDSSYKIKFTYKLSNEPFITPFILCDTKFTQIEVLTLTKK